MKHGMEFNWIFVCELYLQNLTEPIRAMCLVDTHTHTRPSTHFTLIHSREILMPDQSTDTLTVRFGVKHEIPNVSDPRTNWKQNSYMFRAI